MAPPNGNNLDVDLPLRSKEVVLGTVFSFPPHQEVWERGTAEAHVLFTRGNWKWVTEELGSLSEISVQPIVHLAHCLSPQLV